MKKQIFYSILIVFAMVLTIKTVPANAATVDSGICGDNLTWTFDDSGTLTINGTGDMKNYIGDTYVPWYAFRYKIIDVRISAGITSIGKHSFHGCDNMTSIILSKSITNIADYAFTSCQNLKNIEIPENVTSIGREAFSGCGSLENIVMSQNVTTIGDRAFAACRALTGIELPENLTSIGEYTFYGCFSLSHIKIPRNVSNIGKSAFYACNALTDIIFFENITNIEDSAFLFCDTLADVYYAGTVSQWNIISIGSDNEYLTNATIHYNYKETTVSVKTEILNDIFIVTPTDVPVNSYVIFACYKDNALVYIDVVNYQGSTVVPFVTSEEYNNVKIMVFDSINNMIPLCDAQEVEIPENISLFMLN